VRTAIVQRRIDSDALVKEVAAHRHGAAVLFLGTVRDMNEGDAVRSLDYTAYGAMAERELERIVAEATAQWPEADVVVEHRIGTLALGDVSVAIAAAHPHRGEAFDAARYVIEELKKRLPIWKREHYVDGRAEWVANSGSEIILSDAKDRT
jgi:molybdopterin synthase catalytic subunit